MLFNRSFQKGGGGLTVQFTTDNTANLTQPGTKIKKAIHIFLGNPSLHQQNFVSMAVLEFSCARDYLSLYVKLEPLQAY